MYFESWTFKRMKRQLSNIESPVGHNTQEQSDHLSFKLIMKRNSSTWLLTANTSPSWRACSVCVYCSLWRIPAGTTRGLWIEDHARHSWLTMRSISTSSGLQALYRHSSWQQPWDPFTSQATSQEVIFFPWFFLFLVLEYKQTFVPYSISEISLKIVVHGTNDVSHFLVNK